MLVGLKLIIRNQNQMIGIAFAVSHCW